MLTSSFSTKALAEAHICRASQGCLFDALFLNNSQIFKQRFYQHYMLRRHPETSRVPELVGPQHCSSTPSGLRLTPAHASTSEPNKKSFVRQTRYSVSERPSLSHGVVVICSLGANKQPKVTTEDISTQFWFCDLCQVLQPLLAPILANKPLFQERL